MPARSGQRPVGRGSERPDQPLKVLGPGFTAYGHAGAPCRYHPLHGDWTHTAGEVQEKWETEEEAGIKMWFGYIEICTAKRVGVEFWVERSITVPNNSPARYTLWDKIEMHRDCGVIAKSGVCFDLL